MPHLAALRPIGRVDVFQKVLASLDELASSPAYKPGDRLPPERELAERLGVSRTLVRQALKLLEASGKLVSRVGSGTYVADRGRATGATLTSVVPAQVDRDFLEKLIELRSLLEAKIFTGFCQSHTEAQLDELASLLQESDTESAADSELLSLDLSFEEKVCEFAGNPLDLCVQKQVHQTWIMAWTRCGYVPERQDVLHEEHLALLEALRRKRCDEVDRLIRAHVNRV